MPKQERDTAVTAFTQHGFAKKGQAGNQAFGICPFCGLAEHKHAHTFYINRSSLDWDCKSCGRSGGFQSFLREMSLFCESNFKGNPAIKLSKSRGLKLSTLRRFHVGYNPLTDKYILPVMDAQNEKVWDLRIYDGKRMMSTSGCKVGLYGWEELSPDKQDIWLCEGEWDALSMLELQEHINFEGTVLGLPGAGTFKADWVMLFKEKCVRALYDNDDAGREGAAKCHKTIKGVASDLFFLKWDTAFKDKYDVRDYYTEHGAKTLTFILDNLSQTPPGMEEVADVKVGGQRTPSTQYTGNGLHYKEVYARYSKWLKLKDPHVLDVMFGSVIANRIPGNPVWMFLVGPSGATKSELLMSLSTSPNVITTTTLTAPSLISGANFAGGNDPSLLAILNGRMLVNKDFTPILSSMAVVREEIIGILRDVYDGKIEKRFGNGIYRRYDPCFFGILSGVTQVIEVFTEEHVALGERFIKYCIDLPESIDDEKDILRKALGNTSKENIMQADLKDAAKCCLSRDFGDMPDIPVYIQEKLMSLAIWVSNMRATVIRDKYSKEVTHRPYTELATRLAKQFSRVLLGIGGYRWLDTISDEEYEIVKKVGRDTTPSRMEGIVRGMYATNPVGDFSVDTLSHMIKLPPITTQRMMENLVMVGMLEKGKYTRMSSSYRMTEKSLQLIEEGDIYQKPEKKALKVLIPGRRA